MGLVEKVLDFFFNYQLITDGCEGIEGSTVYMKRWFIWNDNRSPVKKRHLYLHHIRRPDRDKEFHDHPWWFLSLILWGGYLEETSKGKKRIRPGMIIFRPAAWQHRVHVDKPSWSLVLTGVKERDWGFWTDKGFVGWRKWGKIKCDELLSGHSPSSPNSCQTTTTSNT